MKKLKIIIGVIAVCMATATPAIASVKTAETIQKTRTTKIVFFEDRQLLRENKIAINGAIKKLNKTVNKTWYVFGGASPSGFDCSGLTMWFYSQLGIELQHRATKQQSAGVATNKPKVGDIVVFKYRGSKYAYHVGIYIGNGKMIHAPKHGHLTRSESIKTFAGNYSDVSYRRIIKTV